MNEHVDLSSPRYKVVQLEDLGHRMVRIHFKDGGARTIDFSIDPTIGSFTDSEFNTLAVTEHNTIGWLGWYDPAVDVVRGDFMPDVGKPFSYVDEFAGPGLPTFNNNVFQPEAGAPHMQGVPTVCIFYGIKIYFGLLEHGVPHFHVNYAEFDASMRIADGFIFDGKLPNRALRMVNEWRELHIDELNENWSRAREGLPLNQIDPVE